MIELKIPRVIKSWGLGKKISPAKSGFIDNGYGRKYAKEQNDPFMLEAFETFNLRPKYLEPTFKVFTGIHYLTGAHTHMHKDTALDGYVHVRCNVMLEKHGVGGLPLIENETLDVEVGDLWIVLASLENHGSTPIRIPKRIIKSFGGLVPIEQVNNIIRG